MAISFPVDKDKMALLLLSLAFQLHVLCMATSGKYRAGEDDEDDAIQAFIILGFLLYLAAFMLIVIIMYGGLDHKIAKIVTLVLAFVGVACTFIGICVFGSLFDDDADIIPPFSFTTYFMGIVSEAAGGVFMLLTIVC